MFQLWASIREINLARSEKEEGLRMLHISGGGGGVGTLQKQVLDIQLVKLCGMTESGCVFCKRHHGREFERRKNERYWSAERMRLFI